MDTISYQYSSTNKFGRKPLQVLAIGAFMAGALLGGLVGGGVAEAVVVPIKAEIYNIQKINKKTGQALHVLSRSIDLFHNMVYTMNTKTQVFGEQYKQEYYRTRNLITQNHNLIMCQICRSKQK